jgi:hypothetical protein
MVRAGLAVRARGEHLSICMQVAQRLGQLQRPAPHGRCRGAACALEVTSGAEFEKNRAVIALNAHAAQRHDARVVREREVHSLPVERGDDLRFGERQ